MRIIRESDRPVFERQTTLGGAGIRNPGFDEFTLADRILGKLRTQESQNIITSMLTNLAEY